MTLCIDIFYVDEITFLHTISRKLQFRTVEYIASETHESIQSSIQKVINIYEKRGFNIEYICADKQFESVREYIRPIHLKISAVGEHVPEVDHSIQTVKGDIQTLYHLMPCNRFPPLIIKEMVEYQVTMRNKLPSLNGISQTMSPLTILTGLPNTTYDSFKLEFGQYVQVHNHPNKTNNMKAQTTPAVALKPSSSENGWYFMSLETGKRILRYKWTILPISTNIIEQMHELADKYKLKNKKTNSPMSKNPNDESTIDSDSQYDIQSHKSTNTSSITSKDRDIHEII